MAFCVECGEMLGEKELGLDGMVPYCPRCKEFRFPMYNVAVSMEVIDQDTGDILLIQQYGKGVYVLVAGYVNRGESAEDAVKREVKEETNLDVNRIVFNKTKFYEKSNTLMCNFAAYVDNAKEISCNEEIDQYSWFSPEEAKGNIRPGSLAEEFLLSYLNKK